jgi:hypothetical protein
MELRGGGGVIRMNMASWYFALELGKRYGWEPRGTLRPRPRGRRAGRAGLGDGSTYRPHTGQHAWYNSYVGLHGRRVTRADARAWAGALEAALPDVPGHDATAHKPRAYPVPAAMARMLHDMPDDDLPDPSQYVRAFEWFSGPRKTLLKEFIAFCRWGGFAIFG